MKLSPFSAATLAAVALLCADIRTSASLAQTKPSGAWLDKATPNWNRPGAAIPPSPAPTSPPEQPTHNWWTGANSPDGPSILASSPKEERYFERCKRLLRPATLAEDKALQDAGWVLFGQAHVFGKQTVMLAMAAVDGMCRPMQYQAFAFVDGRFAGTLSPGLMDSRTDGAIDTIRFVQDPSRTEQGATSGDMVPYASFRRYQESDPLCCPSATSDVTYGLTREDGNPVLTPQLPAQTSPNSSD